MALKVLVVDDEAAIRKLIRMSLERVGFAVVEASDGREALLHLDDTVSLLLSDLSMPGLDGLALVAEVLQRRPKLPVLLMSGFEEAYTRRLNGYNCVKKPFNPRDLIHHVRQALDREGGFCDYHT